MCQVTLTNNETPDVLRKVAGKTNQRLDESYEGLDLWFGIVDARIR